MTPRRGGSLGAALDLDIACKKCPRGVGFRVLRRSQLASHPIRSKNASRPLERRW